MVAKDIVVDAGEQKTLRRAREEVSGGKDEKVHRK